MCDTDINPSMIAYPIPCNDDHEKSEEYVLSRIEDVIMQAKRLRDTVPGYSSHWAKSGIEKQFRTFTPKSYDSQFPE